MLDLKDKLADADYRVDALITVMENNDIEYPTVVELIDSVLADPFAGKASKALASTLDSWITQAIEAEHTEQCADASDALYTAAQEHRELNRWLDRAAFTPAERQGY